MDWSQQQWGQEHRIQVHFCHQLGDLTYVTCCLWAAVGWATPPFDSPIRNRFCALIWTTPEKRRKKYTRKEETKKTVENSKCGVPVRRSCYKHKWHTVGNSKCDVPARERCDKHKRHTHRHVKYPTALSTWSLLWGSSQLMEKMPLWAQNKVQFLIFSRHFNVGIWKKCCTEILSLNMVRGYSERRRWSWQSWHIAFQHFPSEMQVSAKIRNASSFLGDKHLKCCLAYTMMAFIVSPTFAGWEVGSNCLWREQCIKLT
jgi:hypothetical protein